MQDFLLSNAFRLSQHPCMMEFYFSYLKKKKKEEIRHLLGFMGMQFVFQRYWDRLKPKQAWEQSTSILEKCSRSLCDWGMSWVGWAGTLPAIADSQVPFWQQKIGALGAKSDLVHVAWTWGSWNAVWMFIYLAKINMHKLSSVPFSLCINDLPIL